MNVPLYLLNPIRGKYRIDNPNMNEIFASQPGGSTPMTECLRLALDDHLSETKTGQTLLLLVVTDGEANNMKTFNQLLDQIQNGRYGDTQVCLMGLSLRQEDIEFFENEECEDTRIRTIEPFEEEQFQIFRREVIKKEGQYTYDMHIFRGILTNLLPADYDYEAPIQNVRHRCYVTCHGKDRWYGQISCLWNCVSSFCGVILCTPLYMGCCCCCCGWMQGNECGKCRHTETIESCLGCCKGEE